MCDVASSPAMKCTMVTPFAMCVPGPLALEPRLRADEMGVAVCDGWLFTFSVFYIAIAAL